MKPPYKITNRILELVSSISEKVGEAKNYNTSPLNIELRRENHIQTVHASLAIEGNTLDIEQITALLEGKRVIAPKRDILEVQNAIGVYNSLGKIKPYKITELCRIHKILMKGLEPNAGRFRSSSVGIISKSEKVQRVVHIAPPYDRVPFLLKELFEYLKKDLDPIIIKSCVFHYEFEFIHPFMDGNGRMGRLWQTAILNHYNSIFEYLPIEKLIRSRQSLYYKVLAKSDSEGHSTPFIEFMLEVINDSLAESLNQNYIPLKSVDRIEIFCKQLETTVFSRADYISYFKKISSATASRDLKEAFLNGKLDKIGVANATKYKLKKV